MKKIIAICAAASMSVIGTMSVPTAASAQADPFLGQLMLTGATFCPRGWGEADGQLLPISSYSALFSLLGTTYGGDGRTTFALPDLRGRAPIHHGQGAGLSDYRQGSLGGSESIFINTANLPAHRHSVAATNNIADKGGPKGRYLAAGGDDVFYNDGPITRTMASDMIGETGGSLPINHRSPYLAMRWCVAMVGIFPSRD